MEDKKNRMLVGEYWQAIQDNTSRLLACKEAAGQWALLAVAADNILNGSQRELLPEDEIERLRETRFIATSNRAKWSRKVADYIAAGADLQRRLEEVEKRLE